MFVLFIFLFLEIVVSIILGTSLSIILVFKKILFVLPSYAKRLTIALYSTLFTLEHVLFTCSIARQVWAGMHYPCPESGLHPTSFYFSHVLKISKRTDIPIEVRRLFPWIMWILWKNRNKYVIEGLSYEVEDTCRKILSDVDQWFLAQLVNTRMEMNGENARIRVFIKWKNPPPPWLKCNIGFARDKKRMIGGASWVLRNERGIVLMHSRRAFSNLSSLMDVKMNALVWAGESMMAHRMKKVILAIESTELVGVMNRPEAWPSFIGYKYRISRLMVDDDDRTIEYADPQTNRGARSIAQSVIRDDRFQSYVAVGHPEWLNDLFLVESSAVI